jgi:DNA-binding transcriptional LysR family regulator
MQFESLKVFCDVARNRSFSQAAQVNQVTQSAVSQMVAQLEKRMGVQLIDRSTRPLQLTTLGKQYYEGCKALLEQYSELEASLKSAQARVEGSVQVAAIYSVGLGNMNQYVEAFVAGQPEAEVHVEYLHPDQVYEKVLDGSVDLGLVSFPRKSSKLTIVPWRDEEMLFVCAPKHPLASQTSVRLAQLAGLKYIHFSKDLGIRREVDRFLRSRKVSVSVLLEFDNIENIKKAIEIGAGVALLPEPTLRREVASGSVVALPLADARLVRPLGIIYRRHSKLSNAAQGFLELLRQQNPDGTPAEQGTYAGGTDSARAAPGKNGSTPHAKNRKKKK